MSWPAVASDTPSSVAKSLSMPMTTNSEQPSEKPNSTSSARQSLVRAGESAAAVDLLLGVVAAVKVVTPMSHE